MLDNSIAYYDGDGNLAMPTLVARIANLTTSATENVPKTLSPVLANLSYLAIDITSQM
jgi:hypothetical protein